METNTKKLLTKIDSYRRDVRNTPMQNPIVKLGFQLSKEYEKDTISLEKLHKIVKELSDKIAIDRIKDLHLSNINESEDFKVTLDQAILCSYKKYQDFNAFNHFWQSPKIGIVFTGHPTFSLSRETFEVLANLDMDKKEGNPLASLKNIVHAPDDEITLQYEHAWAEDVIKNAQNVLNDIVLSFITFAKEKYPKNWRTFTPKPISLACWIGYDLDGRTDITWKDSFRFRLQEKEIALKQFTSQLNQLIHRYYNDKYIQNLKKLSDKMDRALTAIKEDIQLFSCAMTTKKELVSSIKSLIKSKQVETTNLHDIIKEITTVITNCENDDLAMNLIVIKSQLETTGITAHQIHLRVNAKQIHNATQKILQQFGEEWEEGYLLQRNLNQLIKKIKPYSVNFSALESETATAVRQFIMAAQFFKYIDNKTPIRFLIAECEQPTTILSAILLAKMFGVDDKVDISPLFETPYALEHGARIIDSLLKNDVYIDYVKKRGRLSIQTGFSDGGRFMGQIPCTLAVERLQIKIAKSMVKANLQNVEFLIFNTHGESMGRGAHPNSLDERLHYIFSPFARKCFETKNIEACHEFSFQGGDGFLHFATQQLAKKTLVFALRNHINTFCHENEYDPFYDARELSLDFFLKTKAWQEELFFNPRYETMLSAFDTHMLCKTGSRKSVRQNDVHVSTAHKDPAQRRAIPHNAILQQLGYPINVIGGIGRHQLRDKNNELLNLIKKSKRLQSIFSLVAHAKHLSSLNIIASYGRMLDPEYWSLRGYAGDENNLRDTLLKIGDTLNNDIRSQCFDKILNDLRLDAISLQNLLIELGYDKNLDNVSLIPELDVLHSIRLALIQHIFILATKIPPFSASTNDISEKDVVKYIFELNINEALNALRKTFPKTSSPVDLDNVENNSTYTTTNHTNYDSLHENLIIPIENNYNLIKKISVAISHFYRAHG